MYKIWYTYLVLHGIAVVIADPATFSIGDIGQYVGSATSTPTITGSVIEFTAAAQVDQGVNVFLSPDLQNSIKGIMDSNCKALNSQCLQSVRDGLVNTNTQLVARGIVAVGLIGAGVTAIIALVLPFVFEEHKLIPIPIKLDPSQISAATAAESATEIVVIPTSGPPVTITPKPNPPTVTGTAAPAITTFTSAIDGHQKGDVIISMPEDLANRIAGFIGMASQCSDSQFNSKKVRKRQNDFGNVICASENLVINAAPDGPFHELLVLQPQAFPWTAADAVRAMNVVIAFAQAQAANLRLTPIQAGAVGMAAFAIAWEVLINNKDLSSSNVIPASSLKGTITTPATTAATTTTTTTTTTTCPTPQCNAGCKLIGAIAECSTSCATPSGSCSASSSGTIKITTTATIPWTVVADDLAVPTTSIASAAKAKCTPSNMGVDVVVAQALANKFCTGLDLSKSSSTSIQGNATGLPDPYGSSMFFNFSQTADTCYLGCNTSYTQIISACQFNSHTIYGTGSLQDSCGTFAMSISVPGQMPAPATTASSSVIPTPTLSPPQLQNQQCYGANDFGSHMDIAGSMQNQGASMVCVHFNQTFTSKSGPVQSNLHSVTYGGNLPYHYTVSWIDGCATTATEQSMSEPLGPDNPSVNCVSLLSGDWQNCNNGGAGGHIDAGCLRYNFAATTNAYQMP